MTKIFCTIDNDGEYLNEDAHISAFDSIEDAKAHLLQSYDPAEWNHATAEFDEWASVSDCWIKTTINPHDDENSDIFAPLTRDQVSIQDPGQHPGGNVWWISPRVPVLVLTNINEMEGEE